MKTLAFVASALLAPLVLYSEWKGTAPIWLLGPAFFLALITFVVSATRFWLHVFGILALRLLVLVPAISVLATSLLAITLNVLPWVLWADVIVAFVAIVASIDRRPPPLEQRHA